MSFLNKATAAITRTTNKEKRIIFVGAKRSGKTTALGCMALACDLLSMNDASFSHYIDEKTSGICQVPSDLCQGVFPEETPSGFIYEAQIHLRERKPLRERIATIPVCETAGEDMENLMGPYNESVYKQNPDWVAADILNKYICDSHAYIIALPVSEANLHWVPTEFKDTKDEPQDKYGHFIDPDLTAKRILSAIFSWKERNKTSPPIEGIAILLTKSDKIAHFAKSQQMNLTTSEGQQRFLTTYFRQTTSVLKYYGLEKVKFFPVYVEVEKIRGPDGKISLSTDVNGRKKIALDRQNNLPLFSKDTYQELVRWCLSLS